ncbi:MAG: DNA-3-methyladenine glycosylase family protein, partial [Jatrophihabitantaceae bacterium]
VAKRPGLRSPGAVDGFELAVRAVVGQQISVSGARTLLGRITAEHGLAVFDRFRLFPSAEEFAGIDPETLPMPRARARTLLALAEACADGVLSLDPGADRERERATLLALPGVGPWTADYVQLRTMRDPDVLLNTDLGVRKSAAALGVDLTDGRPGWAPWRSYATHHLWAAPH